MTLFVLNLAFVDLVYCLVYVPTTAGGYLTSYFERAPPFGHGWSYFLPLFNTVTAFVSWMSIALIAVTRCLYIASPSAWKHFCHRKINVYLVLVAIWIYGFAMVSPVLFGVSSKCSGTNLSNAVFIWSVIFEPNFIYEIFVSKMVFSVLK